MLKQLSEVLTLTQAMLTAVKAQQWETAEQIQQDREQLLTQCGNMEAPSDKEESLKIHEVILRTKELEATMQPILELNKRDLFDQHKTRNKRQKMVSAYKNNSG
ncbi:hypothetical protein [Amphritea balenae]|uniref:Flagellar protein FliT n=1 Tax=Amphritea balenae TaxID=452629 RepID=A0A3P1SQ52_9GAMM|nr:hypothetical protein [Amphritea balenae]RRC99253.1 hypothetical protein EHS89_10410 [Amphritea balenae]GGK72703.1 hypothetical protein GCM10007941_23370 [Amphritea balenae]